MGVVVDLVSAGFPCTDISQAGKKAGIGGVQSGLVNEVFRLVEDSRVRPEFLLLENVSYLLNLAQGAGVTHLKVGQNVACLSGTGGFGTHTLAPAAMCMPLPAGFPHVDAAAFIMIYATSHHALVDRAALKAGETVLILGAAGGVGTSAIQIAKAMGAMVIAAASSDDKCALCKSIGADETINYSTEDLRERIKALTGGKGPDVIYDPVGGAYTEPAFRSIAWRGRWCVGG